jgi:hypothetical protein
MNWLTSIHCEEEVYVGEWWVEAPLCRNEEGWAELSLPLPLSLLATVVGRSSPCSEPIRGPHRRRCRRGVAEERLQPLFVYSSSRVWSSVASGSGVPVLPGQIWYGLWVIFFYAWRWWPALTSAERNTLGISDNKVVVSSFRVLVQWHGTGRSPSSFLAMLSRWKDSVKSSDAGSGNKMCNC